MAVVGGTLAPGTVRILRRRGDRWTVETDLEGPGDAGELSGGLAFDGSRILVGAPEMAPGGGALLWRLDASSGAWRPGGRFPLELGTDAGSRTRLGASVALAGDAVVVGDPVGDVVRTWRQETGGGWTPAPALRPESDDGAPEGGAGERITAYGSTLAATADHLVVGAPRARDLRGVVHVYRWDEEEGWSLLARLSPDGLRPGDGFGAAVALGHGRVVVGAPGAYGGLGRAAVFDLADLQAPPAWLENGEPLERVAGRTVPCAEGSADGFDCESVDLVSFLPLSAMGAEPGERVSDIWGWTDPETGREYVLAGRTAGLAVLDITDASTPVFVGLMPANPSGARDIKVYRDHAFLTGDGAGDHGLLVFDVARLRNVAPAEMPATFEPDARYGEVASAHNLIIDTESGFAYTVGTNTGGRSCGGGLHMIDIRDPLNPTFAGCYTDSEGLIWSGRSHDAQCTVYRGPDEAWQGRQICFASNETAMRIVDVTDKSNPVPISSMSHPGTAYVHQGWLTEDQRYLYVNDELDEIVGTTQRTRTLIWDVMELDDPILVAEHLGPDQATDHNLYIEGDRAYLANYQAGFRILDISDPERPVEIGWFDTTPYGDNPPGFGGGAWTAWPFFESGMVVVSSINEGIFILRPQRPVT
jgi:choice-of-anchor B domain-containing protein